MMSNAAISGSFLLYLLTTFYIGYTAWKRTQNTSDYFLGGRSLGPWTSALSACASDMSGWLLLGLPGAVLVSGMGAVWMSIGLLVGAWCNWLFIAKRLRTYSIEVNDSLTLPEFFSNRFNDHGGILQPLSAGFILLFFLFYTSSGLVAGGKLFETVFGLDYQLATLLGAFCIVLYTLFGGFLAVSWTDLFQGLLMLAALLIAPITAINTQGGIGNVIHEISRQNPALLNPWTTPDGQTLSIIAIASSVFWGLGYFGQPHILARFAAIRSNKDVKLARYIALSWTALSLIGAIMVGVSGMIILNGAVLEDSETIFMVLVSTIFNPIIAGILLAAILAAIMSTVDSQLLVSSSALAQDLYKNIFHRSASKKRVLLVSRLAVVLVAVIAFILALDPDSSVLFLVSYAWAGFGAAFGPALIFSLYWKRMNKYGALAGIITGGLVVVIWKQLSGGIFDLYEIVPAFILSAINIVIFSLITKIPEKSILNTFDSMKEKIKLP